MKRIQRSDLMGKILWLVFIAALISSIRHVAWSFGTLEPSGESGFGWIAAIGVDAGLAVMAYGIHQRKKAKRSTKSLWFGIIFFSVMSIYANVMHGASVNGSIVFNPVVNTIILSATLPIMVIYVGDLVSSDDVQLAKKNEQIDERVQKLLNDAKSERDRHEQIVAGLNAKIDTMNANLNARSAEIERLNTELSMAKVNSVPAEQNGWHEQWATYMIEHPNASQRELAEHFGVSVGTVNTRLKKLNGAVQHN